MPAASRCSSSSTTARTPVSISRPGPASSTARDSGVVSSTSGGRSLCAARSFVLVSPVRWATRSDPPSEATIAVRASACVAESARTGAM